MPFWVTACRFRLSARWDGGYQVGPAEVINTAVPVIDTPENVKAAEAATRDRNASYLGVMLEGKYSDQYLKSVGKDAPRFTEEDLRIIASPLDFVGINVYRPTMYVLASDDAPGRSREVVPDVSHPKMDSSGAFSDPRSCTGRRDC